MCITQQWPVQLHRLRRRGWREYPQGWHLSPTTQVVPSYQTLACRDDITKLTRQAGHSFQCAEPAHHFR
jgi:hypothetical protein